jgi:S-adenosylmethionine decarboxylase
MSKSSAAQLGGFSKERHAPAREINTNITVLPTTALTSTQPPHTTHVLGNGADVEPADFFIKKDGVEYAGTHLLVELWGAHNLCDPGLAETALTDAALEAGATILHSYMHPFGPNMGVSGVVVLAESHISIHTWPERGYAAVDIFMCGSCDPYLAVKVLKSVFTPEHVQLCEQKRGLIG